MLRPNIRTKLLVVLAALFTVSFGGLAFWFYQLATQRAMTDLRQSLMTSASIAAKMIDPQEHTQVFQNGVEGDAQYEHIASQLRLVRDVNPQAIDDVYTLVHSPDNPTELLFVAAADEDSVNRVHLREVYAEASKFPEMFKAFDGQPTADTEIGTDKYGAWLSGYAPILDANGKAIAIVGIDMAADEVLRIQADIRNASLLAFVVACLALYIIVFIASDRITRPLRVITNAAHLLENDEKFEPETLAPLARGSDELAQLARVFSKMAEQVQIRHQKLKQEVARLRIEIDEAKRQSQVTEITDSEFFQDLRAKASNMRRRDSEEGE